jgi:hypothetical protein
MAEARRLPVLAADLLVGQFLGRERRAISPRWSWPPLRYR